MLAHVTVSGLNLSAAQNSSHPFVAKELRLSPTYFYSIVIIFNALHKDLLRIAFEAESLKFMVVCIFEFTDFSSALADCYFL